MKILQINHHAPIYDVFVGKGWLNWSRIIVDKRKTSIRMIGGIPLSVNDKQLVNNHFFKEA
jgi:hypothetical protein